MTDQPLTVAEATACILQGIQPLPVEMVGLFQGLGRILGRDITGHHDQPPFAASAMDGWAVQAADIRLASPEAPVHLAISGEAAAGQAFAGTLRSGQAVRIFTGAALPDGSDAVVMQEDCAITADRKVAVRRAVPTGRFIRARGHDFAKGTLLLRAGTYLGPREVALAAGADQPWLAVHRKPRIAVLATGDEIALPGQPRRPDQIVSSNAFYLSALITSLGAEPVHLGVSGDTMPALAQLTADAAGCDLLVTSGGTALGDHDLVRRLLTGTDASLTFSAVAMRPGKAVLSGRVGSLRILGLPGNPVATGIAAHLFLLPAIRALSGLPADPAILTATLEGTLPPTSDNAEYPRARLTPNENGGYRAIPLDRQDSALMTAWCEADCLIERQPRSGALPSGAAVRVIPLAAKLPFRP